MFVLKEQQSEEQHLKDEFPKIVFLEFTIPNVVDIYVFDISNFQFPPA
jgi:hypothetical protein